MALMKPMMVLLKKAFNGTASPEGTLADNVTDENALQTQVDCPRSKSGKLASVCCVCCGCISIRVRGGLVLGKPLQ